MKETKKQAERYNNTNQENSKITKYLKAESDPNEIIAKQNSKQENSYNFGD